jgi:hypothetical protein
MHERCEEQPKMGSPLKGPTLPLLQQAGCKPHRVYFYFISSKSHALRIGKRFDFGDALCGAGLGRL